MARAQRVIGAARRRRGRHRKGTGRLLPPVAAGPTVGAMRITGIDHVVFNVTDPERSLAWWGDLLGLEPVRLEEWRRGEAPFVSVRISADTIIDLFQLERSGENVDHIAVTVEGADLTELPPVVASTSCAARWRCSAPAASGRALRPRSGRQRRRAAHVRPVAPGCSVRAWRAPTTSVGSTGSGPSSPPTAELTHHEPWELRAHASAADRLLGGMRPWIERLDPATYLTLAVLRSWLRRPSTAWVTRGLLLPDDLDRW